MGTIRPPSPVLLFLAVFGSSETAFEWTRRQSESAFGPVQLESGTIRFDTFTDYYAESMGAVLPKRLWAFRDPIDPGRLAEIKRLTNVWEEEFKREFDRENGRPEIIRPLNLDPGYVDLGKLVLASTKDHAHRIYLADGIFAETTLCFTRKEWKPFPWTYPDYRSEDYRTFLDRCRDYLKSLRPAVRRPGAGT